MSKVKIVTFNIRCCYAADGINSFVHRSGLIFDKLTAEAADALCFQEVTPEILRHLKSYLQGYEVYYNGRNEDRGGEGLVIALKKGSLTLKSLDCFWLSDTPTLPGSRFADQSHWPRICQAAEVTTSDGTHLRIYNNHFDLVDTARYKQASLVAERVKADNALCKLPTVIVGDFNDRPDTPTATVFAAAGFVDAAGDEGTFHNFGRELPARKIDYIFTDIAYTQCELWKDQLNGIYLSDHYPVAMTAEI